jgi:SRSO17 transposase
VLDESPLPVLRRLMKWLTPFKACFGHRAQTVSLGHYISGLFSDSPRKSMQAMLARVTAPPAYQTFQHFITDAPWSAAQMWKVLRAQLPEQRGVLILDDTGFPKKGEHSVGVARQYSGTLGKIGNCQVAVTAVLWTGMRAWLVGAALYLPKAWTDDPVRRLKARIPADTVFREKWRLALQLLRQVRAAGLQVTAVVADAGYGDVTIVRRVLHRLKLPYALGISATLTAFPGIPEIRPPRPVQGPRQRRPRAKLLHPEHAPVTVARLAAALPPEAWHTIRWRHGDNPERSARCAGLRVTPAQDWQYGRLAPEVWLLCERPDDGSDQKEKYYFINLPPSTTLVDLVALAHQRWPIEQQYQHLKTELGLDHFEGRTYPGWNHHVVLSAVAYAFLQQERLRRREPSITFEGIRAIVQEVFVGLLFAARPRYAAWLRQAEQLLPLRL